LKNTLLRRNNQEEIWGFFRNPGMTGESRSIKARRMKIREMGRVKKMEKLP
jgi:hypothetical protein